MTPMDTKANGLTEARIIEIAVAHSNYREGEAFEVFSHERIVEFARVIANEAAAEAIETRNRRAALAQPAAPDHAGLVTRLNDMLEATRVGDIDLNATEVHTIGEAIAALSGGGPVAVKPLEWKIRGAEHHTAQSTVGKQGEAAQPTAEGLRKALIEIDGEAPAKEPRDTWTSTDLDEAFWEGKVRGCWEMAVYARTALATTPAQGDAAQPGADGWVDWPGLQQPVDDAEMIELLASDGVIERRLARHLRWELPFKYRRTPASPAASQEGASS